MIEEAKVVTELERHWRERSGARGPKPGTGVAPQALLATHKISLKFFEVDGIAIKKKYVLRGLEVLFGEASFGMCRIVPASHC